MKRPEMDINKMVIPERREVDTVLLVTKIRERLPWRFFLRPGKHLWLVEISRTEQYLISDVENFIENVTDLYHMSTDVYGTKVCWLR